MPDAGKRGDGAFTNARLWSIMKEIRKDRRGEKEMYHFLAYMSRMKLIRRWSLMRNVRSENDAEHSHQVAMIAHMLCLIRNRRYGGQVDAGRVLALATYHEAAEVITGDLSTPIKYFNPGIRKAFGEIEEMAEEKLLSYLPEDLKEDLRPWITQDRTREEWTLVKAADKISAYLKCVEEISCGNDEFRQAQIQLQEAIEAYDLPEVRDFMREFAPSFALSLDQLN